MDQHKHELLGRLFDEASDLPSHEQEAFLEEAAEGDAGLLESLRKLLRIDSEHALAIDRPVVAELGIELALELDSAINAAETEDRFPRPHMIGPYRILHVLGRGGMGIVYEAEQTAPTRRVALKVLRADVATPGMLRRFEHETLVLGRLNHPGIAQIYDAGIAESSGGEQPFLAMELVRGKTLTDHADAFKLAREERLALLAAVADAVHHAHERGVIHRDLKPANVLVDASGQVKVLDFGVATTLDVDQHLSTMHTGVGEVVGTLSYMSPEQVTGRSSEVDARSDVYALGVLAHELLTGRPPFDLQGKLIHEAARIVAEVDPSTLSVHDESLRGDVEWIVGKALAKEAARRYASAAAFASDLRRHLADEPISAGAPSAWHQAVKFSRRHRAWVGGLAATLLALVAGLITSTVLYTRARDRGIELAQALEESEAVTSFIEGIFKAASPEEEKKELTVRALLERSRGSLDEAFEDSARISSRLHLTIANAFDAIGAPEVALFHAKRARDLRASDPTAEPALLSESQLFYGEVLIAAGQSDEAHKVLAAGLDQETEVPRRARYLLQLARNEKDRGSLVAAHKLLDELSAILDHGGVLEATRFDALNLRAILHARAGNIQEAMGSFEKVLAWRLNELGEDHPQTLIARSNLATALSMQGKHAEVLELDRAILETQKRVLGGDHPATLHTMFGIGAGLTILGRHEEAESYLREAVEGNLKVLGGGHIETLSSRESLARCLEVRGKHEEAHATYLEATKEATESLGGSHWVTLLLMDHHGITLRSLGRFDEAIQLHQNAVELAQRGLGPINSMAADALSHLAATLDAAGRHREAISAAERAVTMLASPDIGTPSTGIGVWLVELYLRAEPAALQNPERALEVALALPPEIAVTVEACTARARAYVRLNRWDEGAEALDEAMTGLPDDDPRLAGLVGERDSLQARIRAVTDDN
ncbi:MAG: tetratricopeptide (TPR) repeat protein [Planctomycetota bacterium]|jgi:tetratricopeptide (TPR) repeat protein